MLLCFKDWVDVTQLPHFLKAACLKDLKQLFPAVASPPAPGPEVPASERPQRQSRRLGVSASMNLNSDDDDDTPFGHAMEIQEGDFVVYNAQHGVPPSAVVVQQSSEQIQDVVGVIECICFQPFERKSYKVFEIGACRKNWILLWLKLMPCVLLTGMK
jgi:hypothetical protein